jgi:NitT/TauT family transport system substrate-binding protein
VAGGSVTLFAKIPHASFLMKPENTKKMTPARQKALDKCWHNCLISLIALISIFFIASANEQSAFAEGEMGLAPTKISMGYSRLRISLPIFVAQERGIFAKYGIKADLQMYDTAQSMMESLMDGKIDVAGYTALPITFNAMLRADKQVYFLTTLLEDQHHRISYLLKRVLPAGQKERIKTIADLRGKRIGILPTIAYKAWLEIILQKNGINPEKEVVIQQISPAQQIIALKSGGIDALFTNDPAATSAIVSGVGELISQTVECPHYINDPFLFGSFNVSKPWGEAHPRELKLLTKALDEAVVFVNEHPTEAKEYMIPYLSDQFRPHVSKYPDARYLTSQQSDKAMYAKIIQDYVQMKIIPRSIDLGNLIITGN